MVYWWFAAQHVDEGLRARVWKQCVLYLLNTVVFMCRTARRCCECTVQHPQHHCCKASHRHLWCNRSVLKVCCALQECDVIKQQDYGCCCPVSAHSSAHHCGGRTQQNCVAEMRRCPVISRSMLALCRTPSCSTVVCAGTALQWVRQQFPAHR